MLIQKKISQKQKETKKWLLDRNVTWASHWN